MRLHEAGIPPPETQFPILDTAGELILVADFAWPALRLVVETDGHAYHSGRRRLLVDRYRANALLRAGWHLMRFGYEDVVGRGRHCARLVLMTMRKLASGELWVPLARPLGVGGPLSGPGRCRALSGRREGLLTGRGARRGPVDPADQHTTPPSVRFRGTYPTDKRDVC